MCIPCLPKYKWIIEVLRFYRAVRDFFTKNAVISFNENVLDSL